MSSLVTKAPIDWKYSLIAVGVFFLSIYLLDIFKYSGILPEQNIPPLQFWTVVILAHVIIPIIVYLLLFGLREGLEQTGLLANPLKAFMWSCFFTSPLWLGFGLLAEQELNLELNNIYTKAVLPGFTEEVIFRSFLFGLLMRHANWNFILAAGTVAVIFGIGHWYQGASWLSSLMVFAITFIGSVWFSWLYVKWNFNLWIPIFVHILMNAAWYIFDVDSSALGTVTANIFRVTTIAISISVTIWLERRNGNGILSNTPL